MKNSKNSKNSIHRLSKLDDGAKNLKYSATSELPGNSEKFGSLKTKFDDVWLKTEDAASYLSISIGELRNKTSAGKIPFYKLGRSNRYLLSELRGLLFKNKRGVLYD